MFLIVGLGNPGRKYEGTKHNAGFEVIDELAKRHNIDVSQADMKAVSGKGYINGQKVILIKPTTYMNLSGEAVQAYQSFYKTDAETELVVVYDDISLDPGLIRVRKKGSAGGHNGMKNIIQMLSTDGFPRVRVGIGAKPDNWDLADYVLAPFDKQARPLVDEGVAHAADAVEVILTGDIDKAMSQFNKKATK